MFGRHLQFTSKRRPNGRSFLFLPGPLLSVVGAGPVQQCSCLEAANESATESATGSTTGASTNRSSSGAHLSVAATIEPGACSSSATSSSASARARTEDPAANVSYHSAAATDVSSMGVHHHRGGAQEDWRVADGVVLPHFDPEHCVVARHLLE